jgi:hypothetical protein
VSLRGIAFEQFALDIGIDRESARLSERAYIVIGVHKTRKKPKVAFAFVLWPLLRLDINVDSVEPFSGVTLVEAQDCPDALQ